MKKVIAKPFLKWAGGKTQLIEQIENQLPKNIFESSFTYIEPFVGSGAVLFWMLEQFPNMENAVINDINTDLTNCYISIKEDVEKLINTLSNWQTEFYLLSHNDTEKKEYYYEKRTLFNSRTSNQITQSALFIFLNRTCFNGLFRVNRKNEFNVPIGSYKKPLICNKENLRAVSKVLQRVVILNGDYSETLNLATDNTFFYFDPPYKPLSETSSFNSYAKDEFNDSEQVRLRDFCTQLDDLNHKWILSNSDVKGKNPNDNFFDDLYSDFNIHRVNARRSINANPSKRGKLTELLITNNNREYAQIV
ncbi:DNA adenine methylase [Seonamhaeicola algicola]|uniref:site-specific DNA-methyltransferase (adenine-specific) n=2 Tax=Seonamhaeicola TaxID=1649495 RepID=A0A5C7AW83_9FLAO|nr:DNA adenine methylase [Seonamhaeicola algicola]TXE12928.1 DNA adenine methylase [Seonamhaeicola algicola]